MRVFVLKCQECDGQGFVTGRCPESGEVYRGLEPCPDCGGDGGEPTRVREAFWAYPYHYRPDPAQRAAILEAVERCRRDGSFVVLPAEARVVTDEDGEP